MRFSRRYCSSRSNCCSRSIAIAVRSLPACNTSAVSRVTSTGCLRNASGVPDLIRLPCPCTWRARSESFSQRCEYVGPIACVSPRVAAYMYWIFGGSMGALAATAEGSEGSSIATATVNATPRLTRLCDIEANPPTCSFFLAMSSSGRAEWPGTRAAPTTTSAPLAAARSRSSVRTLPRSLP